MFIDTVPEESAGGPLADFTEGTLTGDVGSTRHLDGDIA